MNDYYDEQKEYRERLKNSYYLVELSGKIFTFLESVNIETFMMIKSTLSHDHEYTDHKWVDDHGKVHITRLHLYPACIFNSLDHEYMSEFATRTLTGAPVTTAPKIKHSQKIRNQKAAYPFLFPEVSYNKKLIREYIRQIRQTVKNLKLKVLTPFPNVYEKFRSVEARDMRDFNHFLELVPAITLFKLYQRPIITINNQRYLVSTIQDILDAKQIFDGVVETTRSSTDPKILELYHEVVKPCLGGATIDVIAESWGKKHKKDSTKTIQRWLEKLSERDWVDIREGLQENKHLYTYFPLYELNEDSNQTRLTNVAKDTERQVKDKSVLSLDLASFCQKDFDLWQKTEGQTSPHTRCIILQLDGSETELTNEDFQKNILCVKHDVCPSENKAELTPETENKPKPVDNHNLSFACPSMSLALKPKSELTQPEPVKNPNVIATPTSNQPKKKWYVKHIPAAEKCGICQQQAVTEEISGLSLTEPLRRCAACLETMKTEYKSVKFHPAYPDLTQEENY
jgi:hypothetical protein